MGKIENTNELVERYQTYLRTLSQKNALVSISERKQKGQECIPLIEVSNKFNPNDTILFVGFNPSGADIDYYKNNNKSKNDVLIYTGESPYYKAMKEFADLCGSVTYSELDVLGIVRKTQSAVVEDFLGKTALSLYAGMLNIFLDAIKGLRPSVIIVANAFVRKLLIAGTDSINLHFPSPKPDGTLKKLQNLYISTNSPNKSSFYSRFELKKDSVYGGYTLTIDKSKADEVQCHLYFSCMLSGQRAIDLGNRENLIWLVRNYLIKKHGMKL